PALYSGYTVIDENVEQPFALPAPARDLFSGSIGVTTPTWRLATASLTLSTGETAIFREATLGTSARVDASVDLRPTTGIRASAQFTHLRLERDRDGSEFSREAIP